MSHITGSTPQDSARCRQERSSVVMPRIVAGERKRETMRTVLPEMEHTAMAFASRSMAMPQTEWEIASTVFWMVNSALRKRLS